MDPELLKLLEELKTSSASIVEFKAKHETEVKELGKAHEETKTALEAALAAQAEQVKSWQQLEAKLIEMQLEQKRSFGSIAPLERKTLGSEFVKSDNFKNQRGHNVNAVEIKDISSLATSAGALVRTDRDPEVYRSIGGCLLYTSPSPRDGLLSRMPSSA